MELITSYLGLINVSSLLTALIQNVINLIIMVIYGQLLFCNFFLILAAELYFMFLEINTS